MIDNEFAEKYLPVYRDGLLNDTLPFWIPRSVDQEHGGFMVARGRAGEVIDTDKGVWQQGRFTWLLGELYNNVQKRGEWLELAKHGIDFIQRKCFDAEDGRMWFHVTREGQPIRKRRYAFSESFAAIAYGELAMAMNEQSHAQKARQLFSTFVDHNTSPKNVSVKFTDVRPTRNIGFPMITIVTAQELRQSIGLENANAVIDQAIDTIREFHIKPDIACVMETVGQNGEILDHFDGRTLNPGHAIEGAWFIMQEGRDRRDDELVQLGCQMLDWMWDRGWDNEFGGLLYFTDVYQKPVQEYWADMKFWWPHCEAIIATLMAYQFTGDEKYRRMHQQVHDWTYQHFPDHQQGEWFGYLDRTGRVTTKLKGNLWKGLFHIPRMQLVCSQLLGSAIATG